MSELALACVARWELEAEEADDMREAYRLDGATDSEVSFLTGYADRRRKCIHMLRLRAEVMELTCGVL